MKNEDMNQIWVIVGIVATLAICVLIFQVVGGSFLVFSAEGLFTKTVWLLPLLMLSAQQLYVIPAFLKGYWKLYSDDEPTLVDLYLPIMNENAIFGSSSSAKVINILWVGVGALVFLNCLPYIGINVIPVLIGGMFGGSAATNFVFYSMLICALLIVCISVVRGFQYMTIRDDIYDLHNKYMLTRGGSVLSWFYRFLYFVPIARTLSMLADLQILDKLTKFNDVENMKVELEEE